MRKARQCSFDTDRRGPQGCLEHKKHRMPNAEGRKCCVIYRGMHSGTNRNEISRSGYSLAEYLPHKYSGRRKRKVGQFQHTSHYWHCVSSVKKYRKHCVSSVKKYLVGPGRPGLGTVKMNNAMSSVTRFRGASAST